MSSPAAVITDSEKLKTLAHSMLQRHLQLCLKESLRNDLEEKYLKDFRETEGGGLKVIAVVGAGASAPIFQRGGEVSERLEEEFGRGDPGYGAAIKRLSRVFGFGEKDLETVLLALSSTPEGEHRVRRRLADIYGHRHPTLLTYEILAHLLKHRFLDAIISFNFDELLDQSLDDEMSASEYVRVISERDCKKEESGAVPTYLKLHGTASDPETLKFTREAYFSMAPRLASLVRSLLGQHRCVILNVGFGMKSFDFTQLLDRPTALDVYDLSYKKFDKHAKKEITQGRPGGVTTIHEIDVERYKTQPPANKAKVADRAGVVLTDLSAALAEHCKNAKIPEFRSIARHHLIASLLNWGEEVIRKPDLYLDYLEDRTTLEIALSGIKGRGLLAVSALAKERCAKYYDLFQLELRRTNPQTKASASDWVTTCRRGGLQPSLISNETFVSVPKLRRYGSSPSKDDSELSNVEMDIAPLCDAIKRELSPKTKIAWKDCGDRKINSWMRDVQKGVEVEVHVMEDSVCGKIFREPEVLPTRTSFRARAVQMLKRKEANGIAVVAETGAWLLAEPYLTLLKKRKKGLKIYAILAFDKRKKELKKAFPEIKIARARWWRHNRHMFLVCRDNEALAGVYYARRQRSLAVAPVYLENEHDRRTLLKSFFTYWKRSLMQPEALSPDDIPSTFEDLEGRQRVVRRRERRVTIPKRDGKFILINGIRHTNRRTGKDRRKSPPGVAV